MDIPEYYRKFQSQPAEKKPDKPQVQENIEKTSAVSGQDIKKQEIIPQDKTVPYNANDFTLNRLEDWKDNTIYTLTGPVTDGIQHNVIINTDRDIPFETLEDYAEYQISTLEGELKGCTLLKKGKLKLTNGADAYEAVFSWYPSGDIRIYQHQVYTLKNKNAFKLTATFTKKTWKTLGPSVLRMMLSFDTGK